MHPCSDTEARELSVHRQALQSLFQGTQRPDDAETDSWRRKALDALRDALGGRYHHAAACRVIEEALG